MRGRLYAAAVATTPAEYLIWLRAALAPPSPYRSAQLESADTIGALLAIQNSA